MNKLQGLAMMKDYFDDNGNKAYLVKVENETAIFTLNNEPTYYQLTWGEFIKRFPRLKGLINDE